MRFAAALLNVCPRSTSIPTGSRAIAQAAYLNKVPFVILRAISDKADDSATMDYPAFEKLAIANNVKVMKELVANI